METTLAYCHLGSWTTITDAEGNLEQEASFDAWGNIRSASDWTSPMSEKLLFDRGYTGHEHLYFYGRCYHPNAPYNDFGLINMNGRMYDPVMSSFLSVDRYVQDPSNSQNFNRYSYCLNNPLKYTDPSGWQMNKPYMASYPAWSFGDNMSYEPRDFQEGSPFMLNYYLKGGTVSYGCGNIGLGGTYGYWLTHSQNSVYNYCPPFVQAQLIQECRANPTISNKRELPENGIDYLSVGESWDENGKGSSTVRWSSGSNMYIAEYGTTFGGVSKAGAQIWSTDMSGLGMEISLIPNEIGNCSFIGQDGTIPGTIPRPMPGSIPVPTADFDYLPVPQGVNIISDQTLLFQTASYLTTGTTKTLLFECTSYAGIAFAGINIGCNAYNGYQYYSCGGNDYQVYAKLTIDSAMSFVGCFWPYGTAVSAAYFFIEMVTDDFNGWGKIK